jgi:short subunit dehydrogenase-like uncharacterized protein
VRWWGPGSLRRQAARREAVASVGAMTPAGSGERAYDLVLFGATGFVGRLTAAYVAGRVPPGLRVALAARSPDRLAALRERLGEAAAGWSLVPADSSDRGAMADLARSARVVATTVGPYGKYGEALVDACAGAGTHYADLTGEVLFIRGSIDRNQATAERSGARLVHACGYDAVPSDLGTLLLADRARADGAGHLGDTTLVARLRGGASGGTIDSMRTVIDAARHDRESRRILADPYALSPARDAEPSGLGPERDAWWAVRDAQVGGWTAPFVMGSFNTRVVRRSNALTRWSYGRTLRYREAMGAPAGPLGAVVGTAVGAGLGLFAAGMALPPTRRLLDRVLPVPGAGPSEQTMRKGWFRSEVSTTTTSGARYRATVGASGDPGYAATAVMFGEAALALAGDPGRLPDRAGVLTPATGLGTALVERLRAVGFRADVERR